MQIRQAVTCCTRWPMPMPKVQPLRCFNVQVAVDTEHHLIVTHEVTNRGSDRSQLANMAKQAKAILQSEELAAVVPSLFVLEFL